MRVLVLNPGSATLKATVLDEPDPDARFDRTLEWSPSEAHSDRAETIAGLLGALPAEGIAPTTIEAVGYRVVHGGAELTEPTLVDDATLDAIDGLADLAPLHNPIAAATIRAARAALPAIPHVATFDTAFHAGLPEAARRYPLPDRWLDEWGIRRYGFHGLSVQWSVRRAGELLDRPPEDLRLVVAHLGGGCSVTAVDGGRSIDTSMGLTPLEGLMMGTRAGSIDPGAVLRAVRLGGDVTAVEDDLEHRSGLLGVSGQTDDMRELLRLETAGDRRAALAIDMFVGRTAAGIAAVATSLPSIDAVVFTGGIGEHAGAVRRRIEARLTALGVPVESDSTNDARDAVLASGPPAVLRIHAREDLVIAAATADLAARPRAPADRP
ncbi:MAG TPA: acetate/propionate family kinase [Candidatus Limnocylindrales bacterium]